MTTADRGHGGEAGSIPENLLSVESVTRLANEFFQNLGTSTERASTAAPSAAAQSAAGAPIGTGGTDVAGKPINTGQATSAAGDSASPAFVANAMSAPVNPSSPLPSWFLAQDGVSLTGDSLDLESLGISTALLDAEMADPDVFATPDHVTDPDFSGTELERLAQVALTEFPSATFVAEKVADHSNTVTEALEYVFADHPFLEGKYDNALSEFEVAGFPSGNEFTGHDSAVLDGIPGFFANIPLTEQFADELLISEAFDAVLASELVQDEYATNLSLVTFDDGVKEVKDVGRDAGQPVSGHGESAYLPDEVVANTVVPIDRGAIDEEATDRSPAPVGSDDEFAPTLAPAFPVKQDMFDAERIREDFPILREKVHGQRISWLDNGATTQKPQSVIDRISYFYEHENSNVHRTAHTLAARATDAYEGAREKIRRFINASSVDEIIYVRGTTEGMNLIANTFGEQNVGEGDEILISWLEHHANIVPWQMLCARKGAKLKVAPVDDSGQIILSEYERLITPRTKLISFTQVSNALGTITPAAEMIEIAHRRGVPVVLDGAQGVLHMRVDVQALKPDFYVFSGHKMFGPTGIGVVYVRSELLEQMPPWQGGGNMIDCVQFDRTTYRDPPWRFEAGTGSIADAVGLGAAIDYIQSVGIENISAHEHELLEYGTAGLLTVPGLRIIGTAQNKAAVMSFVLDGHDPEDVGSYLDQQGIAVRAGHHCAQPILRRFGVTATVRPSLAMYNTTEDLDRLVTALCHLQAGS